MTPGKPIYLGENIEVINFERFSLQTGYIDKLHF